MTVIRLQPDEQRCRACSATVDLPHSTEADCRDAISKELELLLTRARELSTIGWKLAVKNSPGMERRKTERSGAEPKRKRR